MPAGTGFPPGGLMEKQAIFTTAVLVLAIFAFGCVSSQPQAPAVPQLPKNLPSAIKDAQGCISSAGYEWCGALKKCIRPSEENCTAVPPLASAYPLLILTENFPPFNFEDSAGVVAGQSTDIVQEIMRRTGQRGQIELLSWPDAYALATRGPNALLYSADRKPERDAFFKWAGPIGGWEYDFYARGDSAAYPTLASVK